MTLGAFRWSAAVLAVAADALLMDGIRAFGDILVAFL
jgi:hypothetical protein